MARFVPDVKPDDFNNSYGERKVYEALRTLDDRHTVFFFQKTTQFVHLPPPPFRRPPSARRGPGRNGPKETRACFSRFSPHRGCAKVRRMTSVFRLCLRSSAYRLWFVYGFRQNRNRSAHLNG